MLLAPALVLVRGVARALTGRAAASAVLVTDSLDESSMGGDEMFFGGSPAASTPPVSPQRAAMNGSAAEHARERVSKPSVLASCASALATATVASSDDVAQLVSRKPNVASDVVPPPLSTEGIERLLRLRSMARMHPECSTGGNSSDFTAAVQQSGLKISHEFGLDGVWEHDDGRCGVFGGNPTISAETGAVGTSRGGWRFSQTRNARPGANSAPTSGAWRPRDRGAVWRPCVSDVDVMCEDLGCR